MAAAKEPTPPPPVEDGKAELDALMAIIRSLEPLTKNQRERILRYARDKFGVYMGTD